MYELSIVLPVCKPKGDWSVAFVENVLAIKKLFTQVNIEFVVVNDGFETPHLISLFEVLNEQFPFIKFISYVENKGKGYALRTGVKVATAPFVITTDIDFPYQHNNILQVYKRLQMGYDTVVGKRKKDYYKRVPIKRWIISKGCLFLNNAILKLPDCDSQSGLKGFNKYGRKVFLNTTINRFLVDTEFLVLSIRNNLSLSIIDLELNKGIVFSSMGMKVLMTESKNFIYLLRKRKTIESHTKETGFERKENIPDFRFGRI